ncbi:AvrE-family type 3 secretion system effector, partial [Mesorhizobium japonicum]|uniref:AvrE-family type 3 secretion system effector n=1 Tax=Mesorhizobium japonicum TaxID=2066070 RepID=UPI003B5A715F
EDATLNALVKQLQSSGGTVVKVRLELKDSEQNAVHERTLKHELSHDELEQMLCDRSKTRIKAITVSQSASKVDGFTSPTPMVGYSSSSTISVVKTLGKINFSYGLNESIPKSYALDGALANPT